MDDLVAKIEQYRVAAGMPESTFGLRAVNDGKFIPRLRSGRVTLRRIKRALEFMAANPPEEAA